MGIEWKANENTLNSILLAIGRTPLVNLNQTTKDAGISASVYGKCDFLNPSGSLKDRVYYRIITEAINRGSLKKGMEIIEVSTGNAGIYYGINRKIRITQNNLTRDIDLIFPGLTSSMNIFDNSILNLLEISCIPEDILRMEMSQLKELISENKAEGAILLELMGMRVLVGILTYKCHSG